ncbi:hypothetical protein QF042_004798 [Pedobacter sp. W3I1]|uniref:hypothetical protein n=1 Tax=Pedobacter sp. W3I1 TaxID=3042291 RepID=UPI0027833243|nr:hypothetical protein [Pedobacter sp. W3I1]MDQ0641233.1 hypothetical protein [Pedobacter sp. W3I1]
MTLRLLVPDFLINQQVTINFTNVELTTGNWPRPPLWLSGYLYYNDALSSQN